MLNVAVCFMCLHFSNFCFSLSSVADFSNTEAKAPTLGRASSFFFFFFFYLREERYILDRWFECGSW